MNNKFFILLCLPWGLPINICAGDKEPARQAYKVLHIDTNAPSPSNSPSSALSQLSRSPSSSSRSSTNSSTDSPLYEPRVYAGSPRLQVPHRNYCRNCAEACCVSAMYGCIGLCAGVTCMSTIVTLAFLVRQ